MSEIGARDCVTQKRLLGLFENILGYNYIRDLTDRTDNSNIDEVRLREWLGGRGYNNNQVSQAILTLKNIANNVGMSLYDANKEIYELLRYGVNVDNGVGENRSYVHLIDWDNPLANCFEVAEEVTIFGEKQRRPDIVIYVNGIALGVIELKRSKVSVHQGIRQNLRNQQENQIQRFFTTVQLVFAGNDTEGLYYGVIETKEKFWLRWKEFDPTVANELDRSCLQFFDKHRFLEFIQDMLIFDAGVKKAARPNQYFAIKAAQPRIRNKEGGIIWHSQGSGKSLTMIWLAKWIRRSVGDDARVVIITDRDELDKQIESGFRSSEEKIVRAESRWGLINLLNKNNPWLISTLIHKFGINGDEDNIKVGSKKADVFIDDYLEQIRKELPLGFKPKGNIFVFIDECHRTQGGKLNKAMREIMGDGVMIIGFTGTPLFKKDKKKSEEEFGSFIHTYKFDEADRKSVV